PKPRSARRAPAAPGGGSRPPRRSAMDNWPTRSRTRLGTPAALRRGRDRGPAEPFRCRDVTLGASIVRWVLKMPLGEGEYFFLPSLSALRWLGNLEER